MCLATAIAAVVAASGLTSLVGAAPASSGDATGSAQSPIDLRRSEVTFVHRLRAIHFSYPRRADVTVTNTGSPDEKATIRANVPPGALITLGGTRYDLQQFHWHTPSEHEINGRSSPVEMHLVHGAADGSLLVIGRLHRAGADESHAPADLRRPARERGRHARRRGRAHRQAAPA